MLCIWGMEMWFELNENVIFIFKLLTMDYSSGIVLWVLHTFMEAFMKIRGVGGGVFLQTTPPAAKVPPPQLCVASDRDTHPHTLIWRG